MEAWPGIGANPQEGRHLPGSHPQSDRESFTGQLSAQTADSSPCVRQPALSDQKKVQGSRGTPEEGQTHVQRSGRQPAGTSWVRGQRAREGPSQKLEFHWAACNRNPFTEQGGGPQGFLVAAAAESKSSRPQKGTSLLQTQELTCREVK